MNKELDYQNIYDTTFDKEYAMRFNKLKDLLNNGDVYTDRKKFVDFKMQIAREYSFLLKGTDDITDNYFAVLVKEFEGRDENFNRDHIKEFFKNDFEEIKKQKQYQEKSKNSRLLNDEYDEEQTLVYLATFLAIKKLYNDCDGIDPTSKDTTELILNQILKKDKKSSIDGLNKNNDLLERKKIEKVKSLKREFSPLIKKNYYSYEEAAFILCITIEGLKTRIKRGQMIRTSNNNRPLISHNEIERFLKTQNPKLNRL